MATSFYGGEFFGGEFFFSGADEIVGGGGGGPLDMGEESQPFKPIIFIEEPADRFKEQREKNARVREHLRIALEGPQAEEVRSLVEAVPTDSDRPLIDRVDWAALGDEVVQRVEQYAVDARRWAEERKRIEGDDEDLFLLMT